MKKLISVVLALMLAFSTLTVATATEATDVQKEASNVLHFDANSTGWNNFKKVYCHIWEYGGESFFAWQAKKEACTDTDGDGVWTYDLDAKGVTLEEGKLYAVIFSNENGMQTYNLLFDSTVLGDTAYCNGTYYENPEDSLKTAQAAFWRGQDPAKFGPEMCITLIGNVVGTCIPYTESAQDLFEDFLINNLVYARVYSGKSDQRLIDDIAYALKLSDAQVEEAISYSGNSVDWRSDGSGGDYEEPSTPDQLLDADIYVVPVKPYYPDVPSYPMTEGNVLHFDTNSADWKNFNKVYCHIWEYGGESFFAWQAKKEACTDTDGDGVWTYDLDAKGVTLEEGKLYAVIFSNENGMQTYNLLFDSTVLGDTACCDGAIYDSPEDNLKYVQFAYWSNQDANKYGPEKSVKVTGEVLGTCVPSTTTPANMLRDFISNHIHDARLFSGKTDQQLIDDIGAKLNLTQEGAFAAVAMCGENVDWDMFTSTLPNGSFLPDDGDYLVGDADLDGELSVLDASLIQLYLVGKKELESVALLSADADLDGEVSVLDASLIQLILVGKK